MALREWTADQVALPSQLHRLMQEAEYHLACADAPEGDRLSALDELTEWLSDLRTFVRTGVPMADSDRVRSVDPPA